MLFCLFFFIIFFSFLIEQKSHAHNDRKDDEIEEDGECKLALCRGTLIGADAVGVDGYEDHKERGDRSEDRHYYILELTAGLAFLYNIEDKDRDVEGVDGDDRKLRGVKAEGAEDGCGEIRAVEIEEPEAAHKKANDTCVIRHIGARIELGEYFGLGAVTSDSERIEGTCQCEHKTVESAETGYNDEGIKKCTSDITKQVSECGGRTLFNKSINRCTTGKTDKVGDIDHHYDKRTEDEGDGEILLCIFKLGVDRGGNDPTVVCKNRSSDTCKDATEICVRCRRSVHEGLYGVTVDKSGDSAHYNHYCKRNKLNDGRADLELTCKLRAKSVKSVHSENVKGGKRHTKTAGNIRRGIKEDESITCRNPSENAGYSGIVDRRDKPAYHICVLLAYDSLGVVYDTVYLGIFCCEISKRCGTDYHYRAADHPGENAEWHITAYVVKQILRFEEYTRADNDTDDHTDRGKEAVALLKLIVFHFSSPISVFLTYIVSYFMKITSVFFISQKKNSCIS